MDYGTFGQALFDLVTTDTQAGDLGYTIDGSFRVVDPDDPKRFFVRFPNGNFVSALHYNLVPQKPGLPVLVGNDNIGRPIILGIDPNRIGNYLASTSSGAAVGFHSHVRGSGMEFIIDPWMLKYLRVTVSTGTTLVVSEGWYADKGVQVYFPGGTLNLSAYITATSGFQNWIKVGINPATGTLVAVAGTATWGGDFPPPLADLDDIIFESMGYVLLAGAWVNNGQTTLNNYQITDLRYAPSTAQASFEKIITDGRGAPMTDGRGAFMLRSG